MSGGYRSIIVGAGIAALFIAFGVGYYHAALNYPHEEGQPSYRYAVDKPSKVDAGQPAVPDAQLLEYRSPCHDPKGKDESDLCAQWRSAKAGENSAFWTKWGVVIAAVGSGLLLWQIILTRKAVEDTGLATEAMNAANSIAQESARPWLNIENIECYIFRDMFSDPGTNTIMIAISYDIVNYGSTPAIAVADNPIFYNDVMGNNDPRPSHFQDVLRRAPNSGTIIFPGEKRKVEAGGQKRGFPLPDTIQALAIRLKISVTYRANKIERPFITGMDFVIYNESTFSRRMYFQITQLSDLPTKGSLVPEYAGSIAT